MTDVIRGEWTGKEKPKKGFTWWYEISRHAADGDGYVELVQRRITTLPKVAQAAYKKNDGFTAYRAYIGKHKAALEKKVHQELLDDVADA